MIKMKNPNSLLLLLCYYLTGIGGYASLPPLRLVLFQLLWLLPGLLLAGQVKYF